MTFWVTSDLHFGHSNIMKFEEAARSRFIKGEPDVSMMDDMMVREWNQTVQPNDIVYIIGDVSFHNAENTVKVLRRLNGSLELIPGNHDVKLLQNEDVRNCFYAIHDPIYEIKENKRNVVMCHYPIAEWNRCHRGAVHLYGHLHSSKIGGEFDTLRTYNVGMDATGRIVVPLAEAIATAEKGLIKGHHA